MHIIELPDHQLSNSAARRTKFWIKQLAGVDRTKQDGYAFEGEFRRFEETVEVPTGTAFLAYIEDARASGRVDGRYVDLYVVTPDGKLDKARHWYLDAGRGWALKIRDEIADLLDATVAEEAVQAPQHQPVDPAAALAAREEMRQGVARHLADLVRIREALFATPGVSDDVRREVTDVIDGLTGLARSD